MKKPTIKDVAELSEVSKSTVSQYLNKRFNYMSKETKHRIEAAIIELDYQANIVARSLKQKRTSTIGVIVANILHSFSTQVIRSIEDVCNEHDIHVILCNADDDPKKEKKYINMLHAKQVDGLIIFPTGKNMDLYESMVTANFPLVLIDRILEDLDVDTFLLDNDHAVDIAINHFVKQGHKRIGMVSTSLEQHVTPRVERVNAYSKAIKQYNLSSPKEYIKSLKVSDIQKGVREMLSLKEPPTAILSGNDLALIEILHYLKDSKMKIPDDIGLISIDDVTFASVYNPPLTTIAQPTSEIGESAANRLLAKIKEPEKNETFIKRFKGKLVIRESA